MGDGCNDILEVMHGAAEDTRRQTVHTGIVKSISPLMVESDGILLSGKDLLVNDKLLLQSTAISMAGIRGSTTGKCDGCSSSGAPVTFTQTEGALSATLTQAGSLTLGCRVAMVTADMDTFIILCKVVTA